MPGLPLSLCEREEISAALIADREMSWAVSQPIQQVSEFVDAAADIADDVEGPDELATVEVRGNRDQFGACGDFDDDGDGDAQGHQRMAGLMQLVRAE